MKGFYLCHLEEIIKPIIKKELESKSKLILVFPE